MKISEEAGLNHPATSVCPALASYAQQINDRLDDDARRLLAPLIPRLAGTRAGRATQLRRIFVLVDATIREIVPLRLDAVEWTDLANKLRGIAPMINEADVRTARPTVTEVRYEAYKRVGGSNRSAIIDVAKVNAEEAAVDAGFVAYVAANVGDGVYAYNGVYANAAVDAAVYAVASDHVAAAARREIVEATVAAFARAIEVEVT